MTAVDCIHCATAPERRHQVETGRYMWICPACNNRGEASPSESRALASWQLVNDEDLPPHSCRGKGLARFFSRAGKWGARCPGCDLVIDGIATIEGARASWPSAARQACAN